MLTSYSSHINYRLLPSLVFTIRVPDRPVNTVNAFKTEQKSTYTFQGIKRAYNVLFLLIIQQSVNFTLKRFKKNNKTLPKNPPKHCRRCISNKKLLRELYVVICVNALNVEILIKLFYESVVLILSFSVMLNTLNVVNLTEDSTAEFNKVHLLSQSKAKWWTGNEQHILCFCLTKYGR